MVFGNKGVFGYIAITDWKYKDTKYISNKKEKKLGY